jgi:hypothetical protein
MWPLIYGHSDLERGTLVALFSIIDFLSSFKRKRRKCVFPPTIKVAAGYWRLTLGKGRKREGRIAAKGAWGIDLI